ncbi:unnamed protein product [Rhizophagus irregularis]|nr:unnamed protein product [Rhizophagus irregularis]CAB4439422.1 unnamed protein product [Rhizophagus irregularis]
MSQYFDKLKKRISQYFDKLKKNHFPYLSSIEILFYVVILANSIVALIDPIFIWIKSRDSIEIAVVDSLDCFFNLVLVITSGTITVIILLFGYVKKEMYKWYHLQLTLCHAQILVAIFSQFTYMSIMASKYNYNVESPFDLLKYIPWPSILLCIIALIMIKGVREESNRIMIIFYIANCILVMYYIYALTATIETILLAFEEYIKYYNYIIGRKIDIVLCVISYFITVITMINSIICHKNFGKGLKRFILEEEMKPFKESYNYKDLDNLSLYHET